MGKFRLVFTPSARDALALLSKDPGAGKRLRAVQKTLGLLEMNPRHPSLNTHEYSKLSGPQGQKVFEAYAENRTPAAFRVFFCYGPKTGQMTILAITPHP
ncbi:MAG: hypothetical protein WCA22_22900 [Candidatus Binatus sp.]